MQGRIKVANMSSQKLKIAPDGREIGVICPKSLHTARPASKVEKVVPGCVGSSFESLQG